MSSTFDSRTRRRIDDVCASWETAWTVAPVVRRVECRSAICIGPIDGTPRFAFLSVASPIEQVLGNSAHALDRSGSVLSTGVLASRLLDREVAAVLTSSRSTTSDGAVALPPEFVERRAQLRRENVQARFLLRQIGLAEVSSHRGAPARLYDAVAAMWSLDMSLFTDPAMLLTLGADRQRYVDASYTERATDRLPRALGRLRDMGVQSYPRLVIV